MTKKNIILIAAAFLVFVAIWIIFRNVKNDEISADNKTQLSDVAEKVTSGKNIKYSIDKENGNWKVYVTGEVKNPGVYDVSENDRVSDVIEMAGGVTDKADLESINMAAYVVDAQHIVVNKIGDSVDKSQNAIQNNSGSGLININTATVEELDTLPGIGEVMANNIIEYRTNNGGFKNIEEMKNVNRIGEKLFEKIKTLITI